MTAHARHSPPLGAGWAGPPAIIWRVTKLRHLARLYAGGTPDRKNEHYWADGTIPWLNSGAVNQWLITEPSDYITEDAFHNSSTKWISKGALVMALAGQGKTKGKVAQLAIDSTCNQSTAAIVPTDGVTPRFLLWWLTANYDTIRNLAGGELRDGLNLDIVGDIPCPLPAANVQRAIAGYLDRETALIDALVTVKLRVVKLLEERRRALRDHAFRAQPGWRLKRLLADSMAYGVLVPEFVDAGMGIPMIRTYNLSATGGVSHEDLAEIPAGLAQEYQRTSLREGDLILSVVGSMGRSAVVGADEQGFNLNRPLARLQLRPDLPPRLLWHWTQTTHFADLAKLVTGSGTAQPTLNLGDLANFTVGLPQDVDLWPDLLQTLEGACARLDDAERMARSHIGLLRERRQALITAAVTGQLEIPAAA